MWLVGYLSQVKYTLVLFALTRLPGMVRPRLFMIALCHSGLSFPPFSCFLWFDFPSRTERYCAKGSVLFLFLCMREREAYQ